VDPSHPPTSGSEQSGIWAMPDAGADADRPRQWVAPEAVPGSGEGTAHRSRSVTDERTPSEQGNGAGTPTRLPVPLGPMTTSDLLDGGFSILKCRPGAVFGASAVIIIPLHMLQSFLSRNLVDTNSLTQLLDPPSATRSGTRVSAVDVLGAYAGQILATLAVFLVGCALARMVSAWYAGGDVTAVEALKATLKALPVVMAVWVMLLIPNGLALAAGCIGWFFLNPLFMVAAPVIVIEGLGPIAAIGRSVRLVGRRYLWVVLYNFAVTVMAYLATNALTIIPQVLAVALPQPWNWIALGAGQTLVAMIIIPAVAGVAVLLYLDLRIRSEGLDIELKAADVFAGVT